MKEPTLTDLVAAGRRWGKSILSAEAVGTWIRKRAALDLVEQSRYKLPWALGEDSDQTTDGTRGSEDVLDRQGR